MNVILIVDHASDGHLTLFDLMGLCGLSSIDGILDRDAQSRSAYEEFFK